MSRLARSQTPEGVQAWRARLERIGLPRARHLSGQIPEQCGGTGSSFYKTNCGSHAGIQFLFLVSVAAC